MNSGLSSNAIGEKWMNFNLVREFVRFAPIKLKKCFVNYELIHILCAGCPMFIPTIFYCWRNYWCRILFANRPQNGNSFYFFSPVSPCNTSRHVYRLSKEPNKFRCNWDNCGAQNALRILSECCRSIEWNTTTIPNQWENANVECARRP